MLSSRRSTNALPDSVRVHTPPVPDAVPRFPTTHPAPHRCARADLNNDGTVTSDEVHSVLNMLGIRRTDEQVRQMISAVDLNDNGRVEFNEFVDMVAYRMLSADGDTELEQAFRMLENGDESGHISSAELRSMLTTLGPRPLSEREVDDVLSLARPTADGRIEMRGFRKMECWHIPVDGIRRGA